MPSSSPKWRLIDLDSGAEYIAQFPGQDVTSDEGTSYSESWSLGREDPILQWTHGNSKTVSLRARLWAESSKATIERHLEALRDTIKPDPELGRPHVYRLVHGTAVNARCVVDSLGSVSFDSLRNDGSPRGATLTITFRKYEPFDIELSDPNAPPTSTRYYRLAEGETFEHASDSIYGNANLGDLIRRRNPLIDSDQTNQLVVAPEAQDIRRERLEPYSIPLVRTEDFLRIRLFMFNRFSDKTYVAKVLKTAV